VSDPILTSREVCALVRIGRTSLWSLVKRGEIPCYRIGDGVTSAHRFRQSEVMAWFEGRRVGAKKRGKR
jgi:excisionase family DNA binding protein